MLNFKSRYLSYKEAMNYLGIGSYNTLKKYLKDSGIEVIVLGNTKIIDKKDLDEFLSHKEEGGLDNAKSRSRTTNKFHN